MHMHIHMHVPVGISIMDLLILCGTCLFQVNRSTIGSDKLPWKWRCLEWTGDAKKKRWKEVCKWNFLRSRWMLFMLCCTSSKYESKSNSYQEYTANVDYNFQWIQQGYIFGSSWHSGADEETRCAYTRVPPEGYPSFDSTLAARPRQATVRCERWVLLELVDEENAMCQQFNVQRLTVSIIDIERLRTTGNLCFEQVGKN